MSLLLTLGSFFGLEAGLVGLQDAAQQLPSICKGKDVFWSKNLTIHREATLIHLVLSCSPQKYFKIVVE